MKARERSRLGDRTAALAMLDEAVAANPSYAYAYVIRAATFSAMDKYADANTAISKAIEIDPKRADYYLFRAANKVKLQDQAGARADFERSLGLDPRASAIPAYVSNLIALGDHRCALAAIDGASDFLPSTSEANQMRPTVQREVNKLPKAERACAAPVAYGKAFVY
jgi:tetratricopeptide (TPR) repeat protein